MTGARQQPSAKHYRVKVGFDHQVLTKDAHQQPAFHQASADTAFFLGHRQSQPTHLGKAVPGLWGDPLRCIQAQGTADEIVFMLQELDHTRFDHVLQFSRCK
ncbi:hypothetical protein D3C78_1324640 [compost metagenome]